MAELLERFREFWNKHNFPATDRKFLLAVSGGLDSVVMVRLMHEVGITCSIAHCNFQLRGKDADADEQFVASIASHYNFRFHSKRFDTALFSADNAISIQMAARQLRYSWFDELIAQHGYEAVSVAHHADDVAETMLLNLVRGSGPAGMHGIKPIHKKIIRPLLFATRDELEVYAKNQQLHWREDSSNSEKYYLRNKIRLDVMPVLREINPGVAAAMLHHASLVSGYELLLNDYISQLEKDLVKSYYDGSLKTISMEGLARSPAPHILLYHFLKPYGANASVCEELMAANQPGSEFYLEGCKLVTGRDELTIITSQFITDDEYLLNENEQELIMKFGKMVKSVQPIGHPGDFEALPGFVERNTAYIDASRVKFPLRVRKWQKGDYFHPLGMKGRKLLSDYFTDEKISAVTKETLYLLFSEDEVVWVAGHRLDDRFKLTDKTKSCIRLTYIPN